MLDRILLIDGSNLLFQMFYGMPSQIVGLNGEMIGGTLGFIGALMKIVRRTRPSHMAVFFDGEHEQARRRLDAAYKSNRPDYSALPKDITPFSQLDYIYAALDSLGIKHAETSLCETDDWIAGYAMAYGQDAEIVISSMDSDFFQLVTDRVSVLRYRGDNTVICTPSYIYDKFGVAPEQYADYKSLIGDKADNIMGADKIGPKTAVCLLKEFGSLDRILLNVGSIRKPSVKQSISACSDRLRVNYQMIKFCHDYPLPFALNMLVYDLPEVTTKDVLRRIGLIA